MIDCVSEHCVDGTVAHSSRYFLLYTTINHESAELAEIFPARPVTAVVEFKGQTVKRSTSKVTVSVTICVVVTHFKAINLRLA